MLRFHPFGISCSPFLGMQTSPRRAKSETEEAAVADTSERTLQKSLISQKREAMTSQNSFHLLLNIHKLTTHLLMLAPQAPSSTLRKHQLCSLLGELPTLIVASPLSVTSCGQYKKRLPTFVTFPNAQKMGRTMALCAHTSTKCTWECAWPAIFVGGGP